MKYIHELIAPMAFEDFLQKHWGKDYIHILGDESKFSHLFSWKDFTDILSYHQLSSPQFRMYVNQAQVPESQLFVNSPQSSSILSIKQLNLNKVEELLGKGGTIALSGLQRLNPKMRLLAERLEYELGEKVQVNGYLGWNRAMGFSLHWDSHDVIVIQIYGKKKWYVAGETRKHPLSHDLESPEMPNDMLWEGELSQGDFLYLPRGFWHAAEATDGPSLHLTIGVSRKTGVDFYNWINDNLVDFEEVRADIPFYQSEQELELAEKLLKQRLQNFLDQPNLLQQFIDFQQAHRKNQPLSSIPFVLENKWEDDHIFCINTPRRPEVIPLPTHIELNMNGRKYILASESKPLIQHLVEHREATYAIIKELLPIEEEQINLTLSELVTGDVIKLIPRISDN